MPGVGPCFIKVTLENSAVPDQMPQIVASDQDLHCLHENNGCLSLKENKNIKKII